MLLKPLLIGLALLAALRPAPACADDGHNHDAAPAAPGGPALPRFAASSELFELVGVVNGRQLTLYLDRFSDNAPVPGARIELDVGGAKVALKEHADGEFEGTLPHTLREGVTAVTATVAAGNDHDLLAGEFDVHGAGPADAAPAPGWRGGLPWALGGAALLAASAWAVRGRAFKRSAGGAA